ncbi:cobyrinate a,c-diamide synthase [Thalassovita sp.]|uniref:cobyrinate a,c-diamide synthase n=1 Tax=Thalassovita sp. TaxID=1979401 RepID=UPI0029DE86B0|nr:cobyrinate a,c-diamide synthase [Thalassovita sp.]
MTDFPRFMIAGAHKSSGKTVVSTGLAAAFSRTDPGVRTFKKGPDYIDPMWLGLASGASCYNLDFNAMDRDMIAPFFASRAGSLSLVEANKGLYDGMSPDGADSNAELAKLLGLPVVLVIDTRGMTRGIAPLLFGYRAFDPAVNIAGVILNQVGGARHEAKLRRAVETYTDIPVLGSVWRNSALEIGERHLGLTTPAENDHLERIIGGLGDVVTESVDLDRIRAVANAAPDLNPPAMPRKQVPKVGQGLRIGVMRDAAFGFYYPDDLEAFEQAGARLVPIDALRDNHLPDVDGLFIGGGFPEMHMQALADNRTLRHALRGALAAGLPCYAECGGLMYLCESLSHGGRRLPMVGLIPGQAVMHRQPQGRGYVAFESTEAHPWAMPGEAVTAHEFHYASIEGLPEDTVFTRRMTRGTGVSGQRDGIHVANTVAGFCHLRNTCCRPWVSGFLSFVQSCKAERKIPAQ